MYTLILPTISILHIWYVNICNQCVFVNGTQCQNYEDLSSTAWCSPEHEQLVTVLCRLYREV